MISTELFETLRELERPDKLRAVQFLVDELAREEPSLLQPNAEYSIPSPYDAFDAAETLLKVLKDSKAGDAA